VRNAKTLEQQALCFIDNTHAWATYYKPFMYSNPVLRGLLSHSGNKRDHSNIQVIGIDLVFLIVFANHPSYLTPFDRFVITTMSNHNI
jgi:hypothetical protein